MQGLWNFHHTVIRRTCSPSRQITPHEIHTLDVSDTLLLHADVCCQCTNVVWLDLEDSCQAGTSPVDRPLDGPFSIFGAKYRGRGHFPAQRSTLIQRRAIPHTITSSPALDGSPALEGNAGPMDCAARLSLVPDGRPEGTRTIEAHVQHSRVAYLGAADNVARLLPSSLSEFNQPVPRFRHPCSGPHPACLACL